MKLLQAIRIYLSTRLTWKTSKRVATSSPRVHLVKRADGCMYIEPRA